MGAPQAQFEEARPTLFHPHGHRGKLGAPDQSEATHGPIPPVSRPDRLRRRASFSRSGFAALLVPFRGDFANTASALILVAVIVAVAALGNRFSGFVATVGATLWFDVFLTEPYERLAITHRPDIETAVCLFVVGIIVTELAARNRHHHASATEEADYVGLIYEVSELVASGAPATDVRERVRQRAGRSAPPASLPLRGGPGARPMMRLDHDGHVLLGGRVWGVERMGLPGPEIELLVQNRGEPLGRFILTPTPGYEVPLQPRVVAVALADQVGAALRPQLRSA